MEELTMNFSSYILLNASAPEVKTTEECHELYKDENGGFINYLQFIYCDFNNNFTPLGLALYLTWLILLFITVGTVVDYFFVPSLEVVAKTMRLSQNVAGITFLAFGNGAPEIFSSIAGANFGRTQLVISGLFGSAMFLTCMVAGTIVLVQPPFQMVVVHFLRDVIFFLMVAFGTWVSLYYNEISLYVALSYVGVYLFYMAYVLVAHYVKIRYFRQRDTTLPRIATAISTIAPSDITLVESPVPRHSPTQSIITGLDVNGENGAQGIHVETGLTESGASHHYLSDEIAPWGVPPIFRHWDSEEHHMTQMTTNLLDDLDLFLDSADECVTESTQCPLTSSVDTVAVGRPHDSTIIHLHMSTLLLFLHGMCPVNYRKWRTTVWWKKLLNTLRIPVVLFLKFSVPLISLDEKHDNHLKNWCRPLNALHCITTPLFCIFAFDAGRKSLYLSLEVWMIILPIGIVFATCTWVFTSNSVPPKYHAAWAFLAFAGSISWVHMIATEIVSLLMTLGHIWELSDEILGLTILSWGNGIPDFIADVKVANNGFPQMGMSACFGGPLIIVLLGIGIPYVVVTTTTGTGVVHVEYTSMTTLFCSFLCVSLVSALVVFPIMQFKTHKFYGMYIIGLYVIFIIVCWLHEFRIL